MSDQNPPAPVAPPTDSSGTGDPKQTVAYETHQKLLGEKKKLGEKLTTIEQELESLRAKERERENAELEKSKNYEQLLRNREEELKKATEKLTTIEVERLEARKLDAFLRTLGTGTLDERYWGLIPIDQIAVDPTTRAVDEMTVAKAVELYRKSYPETIKRANVPGVPSNAPQGAPGKLTLEEWRGLPLKEKKARMAEVQLK